GRARGSSTPQTATRCVGVLTGSKAVLRGCSPARPRRQIEWSPAIRARLATLLGRRGALRTVANRGHRFPRPLYIADLARFLSRPSKIEFPAPASAPQLRTGKTRAANRFGVDESGLGLRIIR